MCVCNTIYHIYIYVLCIFGPINYVAVVFNNMTFVILHSPYIYFIINLTFSVITSQLHGCICVRNGNDILHGFRFYYSHVFIITYRTLSIRKR